ncbi:MAG: cyanophycin synthetase, partial [Opitutaceae bacterium]
MRPALLPTLFSHEVRSIHCVGVGGMGVGPLAIYLAQLGFSVTGGDDALAEPMRALLARERVTVVPSGDVPAGCDLVVYSSAIAPSHPARAAAVARGLPLVRRGELLAEVLRGKKLVAVCGAHGKTTTAAMLITALRRAQFPAGWVLGGLFADDGLPPARTGSSDWVVAEIDESDGTIDAFSPEITLATNLDWDHPDHYRRLDDFATAFATLFARTKYAVLVSDACALSQRLAAATPPGEDGPQFFTFGRSGDFACEIGGETGEHLRLRLSGRFPIAEAQVHARGDFNAANATAALAAAQLIGAELVPRLLADYAGVSRRQSVLQAGAGLTVLEDYAHHPSEIRALLASLRGRVGDEGRLIVVFQPHRFSRTAQFKSEFAAALALADRVHLLDVYAAGEAPKAGGTAADIYAELKKNSPLLSVDYLPGDDAA